MNNFRSNYFSLPQRSFSSPARQPGFSLMEVLIGILVFAVGMLALASMQGALTRSTAEAKVRTEAVNIAEEEIESQRGFVQLASGGGIFSYADIVDATGTVTRNNVTYTVTQDVTDYYYDLANDVFTYTAPTGVITSDYKNVAVTVTWADDRNFVVNEGTVVTEADISAGSVQVTSTIPRVSVAAAGKLLEETDNTIAGPPVDYNPGARPDIVSLGLGDNKLKESLLPEPDVIRRDELVETGFDVITYSSTDAGSSFLRREEFLAVSCECTLKAAPGDAQLAGVRPTIWAGDEYSEAEFIDKPYGVSANNIQSAFCDPCCRDHHDGGTGSNDPAADPGAIQYNPFRAAADYHGSGHTFAGDHKHYSKDRFGNLTLAVLENDTYVEACKLVRKDGFMRVAQDFRQEGVNVFPFDYLDEAAEVDDYSVYVTDEVLAFLALTPDGYEGSPPTFTPPSRTAEGVTPVPVDDLTAAYTYLPTDLGAEFQQLRSRGIYMDYLSEDLRTVIICLGAGGNADTCSSGDVVLDKTGSVNLLELIPFFELQTTYLARWTETPVNDPIDTTNEALESNNTHSRGVASQEASVGGSQVRASAHSGVPGLTDTDPIDPGFSAEVAHGEIRVIINNDNRPAPNGTIVTGVFTSGVGGVQAANIEIEPTDAICDRTVEGFICLVPPGTGSSLKVSNYHKQNDRDISACSYEATLPGASSTDTANNPFTVFDLDDALDTLIYQVSIESGSCTSL